MFEVDVEATEGSWAKTPPELEGNVYWSKEEVLGVAKSYEEKP